MMRVQLSSPQRVRGHTKVMLFVAAGLALAVGLTGVRVLSGSSGEPSGSDPQPALATNAPTATGWAGDVDTFLARLESTHPEPYHSISREEFVAEVLAFKSRLPGLSEWEARAQFMALVALLSSKGQDGHMVVLPEDTTTLEWRMWPLQLHWFADGVYVVDAQDEGLVGWRVVSIGGKPVAEVASLLENVVTKDNQMTVKARIPTLMTMPDLLGALDLGEAEDLEMTLERGNRSRTVRLDTISMTEYLAWTGRMHPFIARLPHRPGLLALRDQSESIWVRYLPNADAVYVAFNLVHAPFDTVVEQIDRLMTSKRPRRVIVDLRNNPGGETGQYDPLLRALSEPPIDRPGRLFVLTGRVTFSAAANFLGDLDKAACALVVGEPPGAAPRFWDDNEAFLLPYSGLSIGVAERWWDQADREHPGNTFSMDIPVGMKASHYFSGRDPVLQTALREPASRRCS